MSDTGNISLLEVIFLFKRILLLLCAALMLVPPFACAEMQENLLTNPGFEEVGNDGLPIGWYTDAYLTREGISVFRAEDDAYNGDFAAVVENLDMNDARFAQHVKVNPNTMYRLSGWVKADDILDAGRGANLSIEGVYVFSESLYDTDGEWTYIETYGLTDSDQTEVTIFARVGGYSGESMGKAAFDDIALEVVTELPAGAHADAWYTIKTVKAIDVAEKADTETAAPFWPWLCVLAVAYACIACLASRSLQEDCRTEVMRHAAEQRGFRLQMPSFAVMGLIAAFLVRLIVGWNIEGYQVDVNCFTAWGNTMASVGPARFYQSNWCDYTPAYIYVMGLNGLIARSVGSTVAAAFVHKLVPMVCDLIAALLIYRLATECEYSRRQAGVLALIFAFNPAPVINSAAWCQIDSVLCVGLMLVAYLAIHRKWAAVLPMYVLCILVKPQALMLGFLGLAAIILELVRNFKDQQLWKQMGVGLLISAVLAAVIVLPFNPNQESPLWLFNQYSETLKSYPYATVNTANLFYIFRGNWDGIANPASAGACVFFAVMSLGWGAYAFLSQRRKMAYWWLEAAVMAAYAVVFAVLLIIGCPWAVLGTVSMSLAFALVLPVYIRSGKLNNLPICGAALFILLYVFGIKMHERYLFPALFLLGMAYAIHRDRRSLLLLIGTSCVLFINEGIVLDNSIRLGSSMGHLNQDTHALALLLSWLNVGLAFLAIWTCHSVSLKIGPQDRLKTAEEVTNIADEDYDAHAWTPLSYKSSASLKLNRWDAVLMLVITAIYSVVTLTTLGSTKAPQSPWKSSAYDEYVYIDLGQHYDDFTMMYFCQVSYSNFAVAVSDDAGEMAWTDEYPAQMAEGMCYSWRYITPSYVKADGKTEFIGASSFSDVQKLSGRYVRIDPRQVGLTINELIFKDVQGNIIPGASVIGCENSNDASPYYSDPAKLLDEQDSLDGEPSWWNSTYFDEIYHARTAHELLQDKTVYEWTHPPLGKIIMSWFVALFGMTPFGWRFGGALCGILMLPVMYLLVKQLTKRTDMAFVAMMLMTLDCMHFTQTRIATIDSYPVLFIMLSYFFMLRFMQRDIVLDDVKKLLPDLALCGFFMGCGVASKWIGVYAGIGLAVLYFWTCFRHLCMGRMATQMLSMSASAAYTEAEKVILTQRSTKAFRRFVTLSLWCLLFFVTVPVIIYLLSYADRFADRELTGFMDLIRNIIRETEGMLSYHGTPGLGMDHFFYSPWYEWPLMMTPMYYASAAFKPEGMSYAIFCFGNPWVWVIGIAGICYAVFAWVRGHLYGVPNKEGRIHLLRNDWDIVPAFILIGLLAQFLPWVLVPRGTYIYHYFASVPFLILGTTLLLHRITLRWPQGGRWLWISYLALCLVWFILLFPYASGVTVSEAWLDFIRDYPYISLANNYWQSDLLVKLNSFLEKVPILPHVYHH